MTTNLASIPESISTAAPLRARIVAEFSAPREKVFALFADLEGISRYIPMVRHASVSHGRSGTCGIGSQRVCTMRGGMGSLTEKLLRWDPPAGFSYSVAGAMIPSREHVGHLLFEAIGEARTRLEWRHHFFSRYGVVGWIFPFMIRRMSRSAIVNMAKELGVDVRFAP